MKETVQRHPSAEAVLRRRLGEIVHSYFLRSSAATPQRYARQRLGIPQAEMMALAAQLVEERIIVILENHFMPVIVKNSA